MHKFNLLPREIIEERGKRKKRIYYLIVVMLLALFFYLAFQHVEKELILVQNQLSEVEKLYREYEAQNNHEDFIYEIIEDNEARRSIIRKIDKERILWKQIIDDIFSKTPKEIEITKLSLSRSGGITLEGKTQKNYYISKMMKAMQEINKISSVSIVFSKLEENSVSSFYIFSISAKLR